MYSSLQNLSPADLHGQRILLRVDYNVPIQNGIIQDPSRIRASLSSLRYLIESGAKIVLISHFGRPNGEWNKEESLESIAEYLKTSYALPIHWYGEALGEESIKASQELKNGEILFLENVRFYPGEEKNDPMFAKLLAQHADLYVNDAFGAAHRAHASIHAITEQIPSYAGFLMIKEVKVLSNILESPKKPFTFIVGGAKIDTKIGILESLLPVADNIVIGGAMANTFLAAQGYAMQSSLYEKEAFDKALQFLKQCQEKKVQCLLPVDLVCAKEISETVRPNIKKINSLEDGDKALDLGPETLKNIQNLIGNSQTVLWNGPLGLYEMKPFAEGTKTLITILENSQAELIVGGGDSVDALYQLGANFERYHHISTGGGAMLEFMEAKPMPGLQVLLKKN